MSEQEKSGENLLIVPKAILAAGRFVFENFGDCLKRGLPVFAIVLLVQIASGYVPFNMTYPKEIIETFLYAIFAVSWHRYTLLPGERFRQGFALAVGMREIKFAAVAVGTTVLGMLLALLFIAFLTNGVAVILVFLIMTPVYLTVLFTYPAIALDQPIRPGLFLGKGLTLIISYIIAIFMIALILILPAVLFYAGMNMLIKAVTDTTVLTAILSVVSVFLSILFVAIAVSTASFLYRDVIGLEGEAMAGPHEVV